GTHHDLHSCPTRRSSDLLECVVAVTGATDYVTDGTRVVSVTSGHPMMAKVTALGCTASALIGACLAVEKDALIAAAHALAALGRSEEHTSELQSRENLVC